METVDILDTCAHLRCDVFPLLEIKVSLFQKQTALLIIHRLDNRKDLVLQIHQIIDVCIDFMDSEVLPHIPDAIYLYEYDENKAGNATNKEKLGAEFPFTKYFYVYREPEKADDLLAQFMELESSLSVKIAALQKGAE